MRIAILTQPLRRNYGGILQAYALQTVLQRMGHEVVIIDREYPFPSLWTFIMRIGSIIKCIIRRVILRNYSVKVMNPLSPYYNIDNMGYDVLPFVHAHISRSQRMRTTKALFKHLKTGKYDAVVVGSDQVWRPCYSPCITDFYLQGITSDLKVIRVAYAASFGTDVWEYTPYETMVCRELVKKFDAVSVREDSGVRLCEVNLGIKALHVLDPTLLLSKEDYIDLLDYQIEGNKYIASYVLDKQPQKDEIVKDLVRETKYAIKDLSDYKHQLSMEEWLESLMNASIVFTDSFHGCVFSIIFRKPFIAFANDERGLSRFESLLNMFNLSNRMVMSYEEYMCKRKELLHEYDYEQIEEILDLERKKSFNFLDLSINKSFVKSHDN